MTKVWLSLLYNMVHHYFPAPYTPVGSVDQLFPGTWYLTAVDEMHRRSYKRLPLLDSNGKPPMAVLKEMSSGDVATNGQVATRPSVAT